MVQLSKQENSTASPSPDRLTSTTAAAAPPQQQQTTVSTFEVCMLPGQFVQCGFEENIFKSLVGKDQAYLRLVVRITKNFLDNLKHWCDPGPSCKHP